MSAAIKVAPTFKIGFSAKLAAGLVGSAGALYYFNENANRTNRNNNYGGFKKLSPLLGGAVAINQATPAEGKNFGDYQEVYNAIAEKIRLEDDADDGAGRYGLLCRLAWHTSGTYEKEKGTGGSFGGTMNYSPELSDGANAGLEFGRATLLSIKEKFPWLSHGDLWTLGGVCAVQEAGGPKVKWRPGRRDLKEGERAPVENGRLPDASQGADHVKKVFGRMDFNDRETVALIGAHCLGKCHPDRSGYDGPWDESFTRFTNEFFVKLLEGWHVRKWDGPKQYQDDATNSLMMLPTDIALKTDSSFVKYVKLYASDQDAFFKDFSTAYAALLERGIKFPASQKSFVFQTLDEQDE